MINFVTKIAINYNYHSRASYKIEQIYYYFVNFKCRITIPNRNYPSNVLWADLNLTYYSIPRKSE